MARTDGPSCLHPITAQSFAIIDRELGDISLPPDEYAIVRRIIHSTADFEFKDLLRCEGDAIGRGIAAIQAGVPFVVDVQMVAAGIASTLARTFGNPLVCAIDRAPLAPPPPATRAALGMADAIAAYPHAIYIVGNAPTALLQLCAALPPFSPALIVGVPVGFVAVLESKAALARTKHPQIRVEGRKGGSSVAAAIANALILLAWERR